MTTGPRAPIYIRVRFMCEKMGWRDGAIGARIDMSAEAVKELRWRHGIVHRSETPEFSAARQEKARQKWERHCVRSSMGWA